MPSSPPDKPSARGRPFMFAEKMIVRFLDGTFSLIDTVLKPGEGRSQLIRIAVETEIERREAITARKKSRVKTAPSPTPAKKAPSTTARGLKKKPHLVECLRVQTKQAGTIGFRHMVE